MRCLVCDAPQSAWEDKRTTTVRYLESQYGWHGPFCSDACQVAWQAWSERRKFEVAFGSLALAEYLVQARLSGDLRPDAPGDVQYRITDKIAPRNFTLPCEHPEPGTGDKGSCPSCRFRDVTLVAVPRSGGAS